MKKIFLFLILCLSVSAQAVELDYFVNPLFYKDLKPMTRSMNDNVFRITPTSIASSVDGFETLTDYSKCQLIDQSQTRVLLKCVEKDDDKLSDIIIFYLFVLKDAGIEDNICYITSYFYRFRSFYELELNYDEKTNYAIEMSHYIESDDCGITDATNPPQ